jgi:hypothetical protein
MRKEDVAYLLPYGLLAGGHVTPIDHMYFEPTDRALGRDVYEVRAIADGVIYTLQPRDALNETGVPKGREWHVRFAHTCTFTSYFDLLTSLAPDLLAVYNATGGVPPDGIPVKAGQLIGRIGAQTLDFGVYDYNVTLPGFLVPAHYSEEWKVHTVDPFPYFPKMMRQAEPRAGKIDHDVDGRLIGNWFAAGTGGYGQGPDYWERHFAFVPDGLDPTHFFFSIGNWSGQPLQFAVKGNAPNPRNVSVETGLVKVELVQWDVFARNNATRHGLGGPDRLLPGDDIYAANSDVVAGTALLQMTGPRLLKLETFPGKTASEVAGFDDGARTYER